MNATKTAPSILSTGRLSAFRLASHRTSRGIRRVDLRDGTGADSEDCTSELLEGTSRLG